MENKLFFWLNSPELAKLRVSERVANGGHNIPQDVISRRYVAGIILKNAELCQIKKYRNLTRNCVVA
ncbi:hypothetical protein PRMUPPPA20_21580 [Xylanibacter ruminicola]|uniref:Uncharacterized protein n=1 Tax=Xylanibacter ruminicola TaxID=839 RepID=A0AA37I4C6_XYLRU|nr:hypothetical protein PRMUPPPA20_21580 [Xylanibacter ruminicola]